MANQSLEIGLSYNFEVSFHMSLSLYYEFNNFANTVFIFIQL